MIEVHCDKCGKHHTQCRCDRETRPKLDLICFALGIVIATAILSFFLWQFGAFSGHTIASKSSPGVPVTIIDHLGDRHELTQREYGHLFDSAGNELHFHGSYYKIIYAKKEAESE